MLHGKFLFPSLYPMRQLGCIHEENELFFGSFCACRKSKRRTVRQVGFHAPAFYNVQRALVAAADGGVPLEVVYVSLVVLDCPRCNVEAVKYRNDPVTRRPRLGAVAEPPIHNQEAFVPLIGVQGISIQIKIDSRQMLFDCQSLDPVSDIGKKKASLTEVTKAIASAQKA